MSTAGKKPFWVDCVHGKHECFPYDESASVTIRVGDREVRVVVPDYLGGVVVFVAVEVEGMLFCFGRTNEKFNGENCGLVMVAKKIDDSNYEVGVWHELYPWALTHFGFDSEKTA